MQCVSVSVDMDIEPPRLPKKLREGKKRNGKTVKRAWGRSQKAPPRCRYIDWEAAEESGSEVGGSDDEGGGYGSNEEKERAEDQKFIVSDHDSESQEEDETEEERNRITRKEKRLTKDDLQLVLENAGIIGYRTKSKRGARSRVVQMEEEEDDDESDEQQTLCVPRSTGVRQARPNLQQRTESSLTSSQQLLRPEKSMPAAAPPVTKQESPVSTEGFLLEGPLTRPNFLSDDSFYAPPKETEDEGTFYTSVDVPCLSLFPPLNPSPAQTAPQPTKKLFSIFERTSFRVHPEPPVSASASLIPVRSLWSKPGAPPSKAKPHQPPTKAKPQQPTKAKHQQPTKAKIDTTPGTYMRPNGTVYHRSAGGEIEERGHI